MGTVVAIGLKVFGFLTARPQLAAMIGLGLVAGFFFIQDERHSRALAQEKQASAEKAEHDAKLILAQKTKDYELLSQAHINLALKQASWEPATNTVIKEIHLAQANSDNGCTRDPAMRPLSGLRWSPAGPPGAGDKGSPQGR